MRFIAVLSLTATVSLLVFPQSARAQMDSLVFEEDMRIDSCAKGELRINIDNINFFRDNEYEGRITNGYTLPGFWLRPTVSWQPLKNLRVEAGAHMLHYWGANKYPNLNYSDLPEWKGSQMQSGFHVLPFLRAQVDLTRRFTVVVGSLYGGINHHLAEPLYNEETVLSGDPETGVQLLWHPSWLDFDMWINWESFIFDDDYHQESFTYGLATRFKANAATAPLHVYFPLQALVQHRGGEINTEAEDREVKTWVNAAGGIGLTVNTGRQTLSSVSFEILAAYYNQKSGGELPYNDGCGVYATVSARLWRFNLMAGYWWCHNFISIHGNPLFGALSISEDGLRTDNPRLLRIHADYGQPIAKGFSLGIHADLYNSFPVDAYSSTDGWTRESNKLSYSFGIYLRIDTGFLIKKF